MKNYYKIMGLKAGATENEIKSAYRLLAKRFHPDVNPGNAAAAEKFAALGEAYEILSDPVKRADYDRQIVIERQQAQAAQQQAAAQAAARTAYGFARQQQTAYSQQSAQGASQASRQIFQQQQMQIQQLLAKVAEAQHEGYVKGQAAGYNEARLKFAPEIDHLKSELDAATSRESDYAAAVDRYRKRLEATEAEFKSMKARKEEKEAQLSAKLEKALADADKMKKEQAAKVKNAESTQKKIDKLSAETEELKRENAAFKSRLKSLESENGELTSKLFKKDTALTDLKLENNRLSGEKSFYENEYEKAKAEIEEKEQAIEVLNQTIAQWEDFSASLDTAEAMKTLKSGWDKQLRDLKKKLKETHYGTLGVLYIATDEEIKDAFKKLVKKFTKKVETDKSFEAKLFAVNEAAKILTDAKKRKAYNAEIGVSDEEIAEFAENKRKHDEAMSQLEREAGEQEFWAYVEELMYNAQTGDADSQNTLGEMYFDGEELDRDPEQAVYWFKEAAKSKHAEAFCNLGICFLTGDGVDADMEKGKGFIKQAAKLGSARAEEIVNADFALDGDD